jgi:sulfite exporter TauE/SafE
MSNITAKNAPRDYIEIGAAFLIIVAILLVLGQLDLLPNQFGMSETMSYGLIFVVGLVASMSSCIAVTGGLLVAVAAKYNEASIALTPGQRIKPHFYFNAGRILSYTLLGGAIGALGSTLTLSPKINGVLTLVASAVMILLGLQMLRLLPALTRFLPTMPKSVSHFIHDLAERDANSGAFVLGAATFFLPCGFTQALQLYVLAKGSFAVGALTMLAFSLGTLPALLSLSALSSLASGNVQRHFLKFAGAAVIVLGIANIQYGLVLAGSAMNAASVAPVVPLTPGTPTAEAPPAQITAAPDKSDKPDKQVVVMRIDGFSYLPNRFTVMQGVPVEWRIDASEAAACGRILLAPGLGIRKLLSDRSTTMITFVPQQAGEFGFNCGMGMMTPGSKFTVVPNARG